MADIYVRLHHAVDIGDGPSTDHTFNNAGMLVDKTSGWLFIHDQHGTAAAFPQANVKGACRSDAPLVSGELR